jgi:hypothetical protein
MYKTTASERTLCTMPRTFIPGTAIKNKIDRRMVLRGFLGGTQSSNFKKKWFTSKSRMMTTGKKH